MSGFMKMFFLLINLNRLQLYPYSPLFPLYPSLYILSCHPPQSLHHSSLHPPTPHLTHLPLYVCYYHDHSLSAGSDSSHSQASPIAVASSPGLSLASSPVMAISPAGSPSWFVPILSFSATCSSSVSPHGINVCVDLSKFNLQHILASVSSPP